MKKKLRVKVVMLTELWGKGGLVNGLSCESG